MAENFRGVSSISILIQRMDCSHLVKNAQKKKSKKSRMKKKSQSGAEVKAPVEHPKHKVYTNPVLAPITSRELMLELKARGYEGELIFKEIKITEHRINLLRLQ